MYHTPYFQYTILACTLCIPIKGLLKNSRCPLIRNSFFQLVVLYHVYGEYQCYKHEFVMVPDDPVTLGRIVQRTSTDNVTEDPQDLIRKKNKHIQNIYTGQNEFLTNFTEHKTNNYPVMLIAPSGPV